MKDKTVCIVGLGYVGLPLAEAFSKHLKTIGFDRDDKKIGYLNNSNKANIEFTADPSMIKQANFIIICVPTPITKSKEPDLSFVTSATEIVGKNLKKGAIVVLESTVYPGVTEEVVKPILENESKMKCGIDFKIGYSPERINPGDEAHSLDKITKIVAGMDDETTETLAKLYGLITNVYKAKDIRTAEAAKVIDKPFLKTFLKTFIKKASQKKAFSERTVIFSFAMTEGNFILLPAFSRFLHTGM